MSSRLPLAPERRSDLLSRYTLPTTRAISILRYGQAGPPEPIGENTYLYHYPLDVLRDLDIVDTPGTNSIERMEEALTREFVPHSEKIYSWWSYRNQNWEKSDRGRRLDHIWVSPGLKGAFAKHAILKPLRGWKRASDHVPVITDLLETISTRLYCASMP